MALDSKQLKRLSVVFGWISAITLVTLVVLTWRKRNNLGNYNFIPIAFLIIGGKLSKMAKKKSEEESADK